MNYDIVIKRAKKIESLLTNLGAEGRGLHQKVTSIEDDLPSHLIKRIRYIATRRNQAMHESEVEITSSFLADFQSACDEAEKELFELVQDAKSYFGDIEIENDDYSLSIVRFIIRDKEILFSIEGEDSKADTFYIDGLATKSNENFFIASNLSVRYQKHQTHSSDKASFVLRSYKITKKGNCKLNGIWLQNSSRWSFKAKLKPIHLKG
jgi:hypothetical protein